MPVSPSKRRTLLAAGAATAIGSLTGCLVEVSAIGASAKAGVTGTVEEPRSIWVRNEDRRAHRVAVQIADGEGETVFRDQVEMAPDSEIEDVWRTRRVGRYAISVETDTGLAGSGSMRVCVGFYDTGITVYTDSIEIGQAHGDPTAAHCSIEGA